MFGLNEMFCPKCGKAMSENPKWPGYWRCPDYAIPLNDSPPYRFKCDGSHLTDQGVRLFDEALHKEHAKQNPPKP